MKNIMLITNNEKKKNIESANEIRSLIEERGGKVTWTVMPAPGDESQMDVPESTDIILTIGGDGTIVRSAQRTIYSQVPIIGVNRGHLGYLCEINNENLISGIEALIDENYYIEKRMMLTGTLEKEAGKIKKYHALNDIAITSKNGHTVIKINVYVNETFLYSFEGDGIVLATPTGSTGYNLSAGGPIAEPRTEVMILTPLNPHALNRRSIVLDPSDEIALVVESRRSFKRECATVSFDGAHRRNLIDLERVVIRKAKEKIGFIRLEEDSFVERMQKRLGG